MSDDARPLLQVIVGSTRPGRAGLPVGRWILEFADKHGGFATEWVDLADVALPLLDEPEHPRLRRYVHDHTKRWSETISRADAFVFVVPEYNHGINAATKNAVDYLVHEWAHKAVGFVSYGGVSGGTRAVQSLKPTLSALRTMPLTESVIVPFVASRLEGVGDDRRFVPAPETEEGATAMLDALTRVAPALAHLRAPGGDG